MFRKFIILFVFLLNVSLFADGHLHCSSELQEILTTIRKLPQANELVLKILKDGPLYIESNKSRYKGFEGYWSPGSRSVWITKSKKTTKGTLVSTLLFELHNAAGNDEFERLNDLAYWGKISKKNYVEGVERFEHNNVFSTMKMLREGKEKEYYPPNAHFRFPKDFETYFKMQKKSGHSGFIAKNYKRLAPRYARR